MENRKEVYFDNSATTRVFDECPGRRSVEAMTVRLRQYLLQTYEGRGGGTVHPGRPGRRSRGSLKVKEKEIVFTSGGTESNNMALIGAAHCNQKRAGNHI